MVATAVQAAMAERSARTKITQDRVLLELARMGFVNIRCLFKKGQLLPIEELDEADSLVAELGDLTRFGHPRELMAYLERRYVR